MSSERLDGASGVSIDCPFYFSGSIKERLRTIFFDGRLTTLLSQVYKYDYPTSEKKNGFMLVARPGQN